MLLFDTVLKTWLGPFARPPDVGARLLRQGLACYPYRLPAMAAPLPGGDWPQVEPVRVWPASSLVDLRAASAIRRTAFGFEQGAALTYFEDMAGDWLRGDPARLYLAALGDDGQPLAIGALIMGADLPGVYVMATWPQAQRLGLAKAILARMLADAAHEGHRLIALTAGAQAYSLYRQFGFEHIFEYELYRLRS